VEEVCRIGFRYKGITTGDRTQVSPVHGEATWWERKAKESNGKVKVEENEVLEATGCGQVAMKVT
jgi:hypothetical protein